MYQYQLKQSAFRAFLENERREWLAAGMSEADIHRIHFGAEHENGRGGDYGVWLSERKHCRPDRKYAPGVPVAIDTVDPDNTWIGGGKGGLDEVEVNADLDAALETLTELQLFCFVGVFLNDETETMVAARLKITQQMVDKHIRAAKKKLQKFFQE